MRLKWTCIEIKCGAEMADELGAALAEAFGVGVEVLWEGIRFYLMEDFFFDEGRRTLDELLRTFQRVRSGEAPSPVYTISTLLEEDWMEQWKLHFKPLRVGKHWVIAPTWEKVEPGPGDRIIRIDPGRAFGTGHHETTKLCLEWLEEWTEGKHSGRARALLDVGTGSGILAIAGALVGFTRTLAVDNDPEAVEVAKENLILNRVADVIQLHLGTVDDLHDGFDVVLANLQCLPLIEMAELLVQRLNGAGSLVLSGILVEQQAQVKAAYEALDLKLRLVRVAGEWCLLEWEKRAVGNRQ
jgi:ribosomal protein L11 methyltransferase